jgi:hypothetical protein
MEERYGHVDRDQMKRDTIHSPNFPGSSLMYFVCFPDVAVVHSQQASIFVWSASDHTVRKAISVSICAWNTCSQQTGVQIYSIEPAIPKMLM